VNELALFAGAGGGILGGHLLGWRTICAVERDAYAAQVLAQRQNDRALRPFPIWSDVCSFDGRPWRGLVDVVSGGFPCQDISLAGKGEGLSGKRSGMWFEMARIVDQVRPEFVYVENSPALTYRGLGRVLGDLASLRFDAEWGVLAASSVGAKHKRERIWIVAHAQCSERRAKRGACDGLARKVRLPQREKSTGWAGVGREDVADSSCGRCEFSLEAVCAGRDATQPGGSQLPDADRRGGLPCGLGRKQRPQDDGSHRISERDAWPPEPDVGRMAHGVANRVDRLKALGNGQVPRVAATAFAALSRSMINALKATA